MQAVVLGILQGATEFLPVSSSGHLVVVPWLLGWQSPGLAFDAVVHWGTALAVIIYFWREWVALLRVTWRTLVSSGKGRYERRHGPDLGHGPGGRNLLWLIVVGTVPGVLLGYFLQDFFEAMFARPTAAAGFLFVTAALLAASERLGRRERDLQDLGFLDALLIGIGQALAIFPGVSRSGATIAAGLARGMQREPAAHFSFLLATPIVVGAGLLKVVDLMVAGGLRRQATTLAVGFVVSGLVGLGCVHFLLRYLKSRRLYPFAIYCVLFGGLSLIISIVR